MQFDDYGVNAIRFYFTFAKGFAPDWECALVVTINTKINEEQYQGVVRFVSGVFTPENESLPSI